MVITYYGLSCFKIQAGDTSIVFDLPSKKSSVKPPRFHVDMALESHNHIGHNGAQDIPDKKETFLINESGEYEVKGIYVGGIKTYHDSLAGKKYGTNLIYIVRFENINLCFMGDYGENDLRPEIKEAIGKVDILFVPIGGEAVLEPEAAVKVINQIEPAIAIPMHYQNQGKLKAFLAEFGEKDIKPIEKFSIKKKDIIEDKGAQIVVLLSL